MPERRAPDVVARLYDVPPWLVAPDYPTPRFPRLRWMLRRVWPLPALGVRPDAKPSEDPDA